MTYGNTVKNIENLLSDVEDVISILENMIKRPTGKFENEKVTDIYNQLLKAYALKASLLTSRGIGFMTSI